MEAMRSLKSPITAAVFALGAASVLVACDDGRKVAEAVAVDTLGKLSDVVKEDVAQVRRGLPQGAAKLGPMLDPDTLASPVLVQKAIAHARSAVPDLDVAKSTFFSYADATGTVVRSETDPDVLAGKSIVAAFPPLKKALDQGGLAEAWGEQKDLRGVKMGPDLAWVIAVPVKDEKGATKGAFVTGWSLRAYAHRLENAAQTVVREAAEKAGKKNPSLVYVFVVKGKTAYGAPLAPDVNATAIEGLDLVGKTSAGPYRGTLEITGRGFGVAGTRAPDLGDDAVLAVLATEI
jgi:hypothetical protein